MLTQEQENALTEMATAGVAAERATKLPAEISIAQCALESGYLTHAPGNNCFGIKANGHGSGTQIISTHEVIHGTRVFQNLSFEKYDSLSDCFTDHARLLTEGTPYRASWMQFCADGNMNEFIRNFGPIYATDPNYVANILEMANSQRIIEAAQNARAVSPVNA